MARKAIAMNFLVSIPGAITYKGSETQADAVRGLPLDRLLIETDCPFLAPVPHRGKTNEPSYVPLVAAKVAAIKGVTVEDVARTTTINALRLFRIPVEEEVRITYKIRGSLYLNITNRCTNACTFCPKRDDYRVKGHLLKLPGEPTAAEALAGIGDPARFDEVVFCGFGEPLLRLDAVKEIAAELKRAGRGCGSTRRVGKSRPWRDILPELSGLGRLSFSLTRRRATTPGSARTGTGRHRFPPCSTSSGRPRSTYRR